MEKNTNNIIEAKKLLNNANKLLSNENDEEIQLLRQILHNIGSRLADKGYDKLNIQLQKA